MADVYTRIGYIKGATGATGAQGAKGDQGDAATIQVGTVTTVAYGQTANVVNSGTSGAAVFDFTIPQGKPGEQTTDMQNLTLGSITASSASFPVPAVGETGKVLWGKVVKWFSDMSALVATKLNSANVVNNLTTTASGYALDARQGKELLGKIGSYNYTNGSVLWNGSIAAGDTQTINITTNGLCCLSELYTSENIDLTSASGVPYVTVNVNNKPVFTTQAFIARLVRASGTCFPVKSGDVVKISVLNKNLSNCLVRIVPANF